MANRWKNVLNDADVTDHSVFINRRQIMAGVAGLGLATTIGGPRAALAQEALEPNSFEDISQLQQLL